mmetsp:Transcript_95485/g.309397  ORF Transcript_95485/g.309397 Transcript_95485/m.309397 type:complete len:103 (-) Transcript_95485:334-642(-)
MPTLQNLSRLALLPSHSCLLSHGISRSEKCCRLEMCPEYRVWGYGMCHIGHCRSGVPICRRQQLCWSMLNCKGWSLQAVGAQTRRHHPIYHHLRQERPMQSP